MANTTPPDIITGKVIVVTTKYIDFDRTNPENTPISNFGYINPEYVVDGVLDDTWAKDGYVFVGTAEITIKLLPTEVINSATIAALRVQKDNIFMKYQADIEEVNSKIQNLMALSHIPIPEEATEPQ